MTNFKLVDMVFYKQIFKVLIGDIKMTNKPVYSMIDHTACYICNYVLYCILIIPWLNSTFIGKELKYFTVKSVLVIFLCVKTEHIWYSIQELYSLMLQLRIFLFNLSIFTFVSMWTSLMNWKCNKCYTLCRNTIIIDSYKSTCIKILSI